LSQRWFGSAEPALHAVHERGETALQAGRETQPGRDEHFRFVALYGIDQRGSDLIG
jgi:hypothetical protein